MEKVIEWWTPYREAYRQTHIQRRGEEKSSSRSYTEREKESSLHVAALTRAQARSEAQSASHSLSGDAINPPMSNGQTRSLSNHVHDQVDRSTSCPSRSEYSPMNGDTETECDSSPMNVCE